MTKASWISKTILPRSLTIIFGGLFIAILYTGCVSVQLGPKGPENAKNVHFEAPASPYQKFEIPDVDRAWKSTKNGNSISFRTTCNDPVEAEIESIQSTIQNGLDSSTVESSVKTMYNGREALLSIIEGKLDGVATKLELMIFKKNHCTYTLTYVALPQNFKKDQAVFDTFLKKFEAP